MNQQKLYIPNSLLLQKKREIEKKNFMCPFYEKLPYFQNLCGEIKLVIN